MPSKQRGEKLRGIIKNIWDETFKYESKEQVLTNWVQYDQAHIHRSGKSTIICVWMALYRIGHVRQYK